MLPANSSQRPTTPHAVQEDQYTAFKTKRQQQGGAQHMRVPVAVREHLAANVLSHHRAAFQVHQHAAHGRRLGALQLRLGHALGHRLRQGGGGGHGGWGGG